MNATPSLAPYSKICADFTENLRYEAIPQTAIEQAKRSFLDLFGCIIRALREKEAVPARTLIRTMGGSAQASVIGEKTGSTILNAAFYHGYLGHIMSMDDVERFSVVHPSIVVMPSALAVAEWRKKNGKDLLTAIVAGYEIMSRIGSAISPAHYQIWHTTSTTGAFGSAMAAGKLFDLKGDAMNWALGNAGTMAAGLWQYLQDGGMSKFLHPGRASVNGVLAAYMASEGFSGATRILEGTQGFFAGYARQEIDPKVFADLGNHFRTAEVSIKPYPCCRHLHSALDAADALRAEAGGVEVKAIRVKTYNTVMRASNIEDPQKPLQARFSMKYCVSATWLGKQPVTEPCFTPDAIQDAAARDFMKRITVSADPELDGMMPKYWPCRMEADLADGRTVKKEILSPKGDPDNPVDWKGIKEKFVMMTEGVVQEKDCKSIFDVFENLDSQKDVSELIRRVNAVGDFSTSE